MSPPTLEREPSRSELTKPHGRWAALAGATASQVGLSFLEQGVPSLVPFLKEGLQLSNASAGIYGTGINLGRAIAGVFAVGPVNRHNERRTILVGTCGAGLFAIAAATAGPAPLVLLFLVLCGITQTVAILASINAIAEWFRSGSKGIAMGVRQTAVPVGGVMAAASLPFLALELGWRSALLVAGGLAIATALVGSAIYRDYEPDAARSRPRPSVREAVVSVLGESRIRRAILVGSVLAGCQYVTIAYIQLFLVEELGTGTGLAAAALIVVQACGIAGRLMWGSISDVFFGGSRRGVLAIMLGIAAAGSVGMSMVPASAAWLAFPFVAALGLAAVGAPGMFLVQIADLAPRRYGAATLGVAISVIQGSTFVMPPIFGLLIDATGAYRTSWAALAAILVLTVPIALSIRPRSGS